MQFEPVNALTAPTVQMEDELVTLLPERESLMSITIMPVITVTPVIVVGNAIAVQAGTYASSVTASLAQWVVVP